jgi:hypothetical protein
MPTASTREVQDISLLRAQLTLLQNTKETLFSFPILLYPYTPVFLES